MGVSMDVAVKGAQGAGQRASEIPKVTHAEAGRLAQTEYERVLALLEELEGDDWAQPTYCTEWNVREMVAHLAGAVTGSTSFAEFRRQNMQNPYVKEFEEPVDGTNKLQIEEREGKTTAELVEEFRQSGQIAVRKRQNLPWLLRKLRVPMGSMGLTSFEYLMDTIYPRDQWMHRYDICAATGREMEVTAAHDGRMVALVLRDIADKLRQELADRSVALRLTGEAGGNYLFGGAADPDCTIEMDAFTFCLRSSGRITVEEASERVTVMGDGATAVWFLRNMEVMF
ncbi:MAG: maleylpyruvate isomerase family mycothiol-dependent enzyme [Candidatus Promineifilaceae bacterium]|nr:maleylpyruvate isomerase family mycothiol-dependent enzyme [Candidatus Promineifilaceae bacterium]